jgi:hypothetical protein
MAVTIISKNSTVASKRPTAANLTAGELGLNLEASDPGLYFEDSAGNIRKIGGAHYGATAPNATPAGQTGNSVGELWYDTTVGILKTWNGTTWIAAGALDTNSFVGSGLPTAVLPGGGTLRPDNSALVDGDEYYDLTAGQERAYKYVVATTSWTPADNKIFISDNIPPAAATFAGDLWWDSTTLENFIYYNDGTSSQWVQQF